MQSIEWLADAYNLSLDFDGLKQTELKAQEQNNTNGLPPTIGCEIEVNHSTVFPQLIDEYFGEKDERGVRSSSYRDLPAQDKQAFDAELKTLSEPILPEYQATREHGIPKGKDCFWEFANKPTYSWSTLAAEVDLLYRAELIPDKHEHSLHVTLGNVSPAGGGMSLILSGLELSFVQPSRIERATRHHHADKRSAWARRGDEGLRKRTGIELRLGAKVATELRTLTVSSPTQAKDIFMKSQLLTTVLCAFRQRQQSSDSHTKALGKLWPEYRSLIKGLWEERGLPVESWGKPYENREKWLGWAACIAARGVSGTLESQVVRDVDQIVWSAQEKLFR